MTNEKWYVLKINNLYYGRGGLVRPISLAKKYPHNMAIYQRGLLAEQRRWPKESIKIIEYQDPTPNAA